ncbi:MAG: hypothetical protein GX665_12575 [Gammaproteobacteria bacterium]|nr:hypothetical protein [Gammaproteobacteria bacterium]
MNQITTYAQLVRRHSANYITLEQFRLEHMPHISNEQHLLRVLAQHPVPLRVARLHKSQRAARIVFLTDLAAWLDQNEAASAAA